MPAAKTWTPEMDAVLIKYLKLETREQIAERLGKTRSAVTGRVDRLGLSGTVAPGTAKKWTDDEVQFLKDNLSEMTMTEMARDLGRGLSAVSKKMEALGIRPVRRIQQSAQLYHAPKKSKPVVEIPPTARPWLTRMRGECKYPYGPRGNVLSCCAPEWMGSGYCESHAALCGGYIRKVAA